jgi:hypothetical protein
MKYLNLIITTLICALIIQLTAGCGAARVNPKSLPKGAKLKKELTLPVEIPLVIYAPKNHLENSFFGKYNAKRIEPGKALKSALLDVSRNYFPDTEIIDLKSDKPYGFLLDIEPDWEFERGKIESVLKYRLEDAEGKLLLEGEKKYKADLTYDNYTAGFQNAATRAYQLIMVRILNVLQPKAENFTARKASNLVDPLALANLDKPVSSGTGFYINKNGNLLTAAHVINSCMVTKLQSGDDVIDAKIDFTSNLLDVAVLSTGSKPQNFLRIRNGDTINLGEKVTTVSFPLKGLLAASPNLTIGNVSSKKALTGSLGLFQFSAPVQPGSSGGPIVGEQGDVLGIVTSTLNTAALAKKGVLSQNINFGLKLQHFRKFLNKHNIQYQDFSKKDKGKTDAEIALASTVQIACYQ